jgi:hypothetical protein
MQRIVLDAFFHMMPGHRLSRNIFTGGYRTNYGRYSPDDVYHPNGASMLYSDLQRDFDLRLLHQPYSEMTLADADILVIPNPDYPLYEGASPYRIDAPDIVALVNFLQRGGSVILMINSFLSKSDFWEENFDLERIAPLLDRLGLRWDHNFMSDDDSILPARHGDLTVGYGQGGRVWEGKLPPGAEPLLTFKGEIFGFTLRLGRGKLAVVGDSGLVSNGLYHFPGFQNAAFLAKLFGEMSPAWGTGPATAFERFGFGHVSAATSEQGITDRLFRTLRPRGRFEIDHHYRHSTHEDPSVRVEASEAVAALPINLAVLAGRKSVSARLPFVNVQEGLPTATFEASLNVSARSSGIGTDYVIAGSQVSDTSSWSDIGADPAVFGAIGELVRVNTIVQILAGTTPDGALRYFTLKQGQTLYDRNTRNPHYGFDILLASRNLVLAPTINQQ